MDKIDEELQPKVTIALLTYNQEKFIRQAIEGILIQTYTNYEILISDDCSTDQTIDIIQEYKAKYPGKFKVMRNEMNIGSSKNFKQLLQNCDGNYIALLDGDDFWIHPEKLKLQVGFLENNNDYSSSFHQAKVLKQNDNVGFADFIPPKYSSQREFTIEDVMNDLFMPTSSIVFRNQNIIPEWFDELIVCDKPLHLINLTYGKVKYIDQCMCIYRVHDAGVWSTKRIDKSIEFNRQKIRMLNYFDVFSNFNYRSMVKQAIKKCEFIIYINYVKSNHVSLNESNNDSTKFKITNFFLGKQVYIFGTGEAAINSYDLLTYLKVPIKCFIDNDKNKQGTKLFELPIISPIELTVKENSYIVVGSMYFNEIKEQLIEMGLQEDKQFAMYTELLIAIDNLKEKGVLK